MSAVFLRRGERRFLATGLSRGPWDPGAQHGGAPSGLLLRAFEQTSPDNGLMLARVTFEFVSPVPIAELEVHAEVLRGGRRAQFLEGAITADGREVVRARALRLARTSLSAGHGADAKPPPGPERGVPSDDPPSEDPPGDHERGEDPRGDHETFATDAMDIRVVAGEYYEPGPATAWFRLRVPLVEGEHPTPLQRLAAASDFGNGVSAALSWEEHVFINADLTLLVERDPVGKWICLQSRTRVIEGGIGAAESVLYDERGRVGCALQALLVARR